MRTNASVFRPAIQETLELIREFNTEKQCTFLTSSNYIHGEAAKLGFLLSSLIAERSGTGRAYRSFFVNCGLEALSGAIKLARQTSVRQRKRDDGWVLVVDGEWRLQPLLDPTSEGSEWGLLPHVRFVASVSDAMEELARRRWSAIIDVRYRHSGSGDSATEAVARGRAHGAMVICCDFASELRDGDLMVYPSDPDVVVFGENLTQRQLPFGCFVMTEQAQAVWNNPVDCFAQTSTFGGNKLCTAAVLRAMDRHGFVSEAHREVFRRIDADFAAVVQYWGRYVNPGLAALAGIFGMDLDVQRASGARLYIREERDVIDCSGGFGSNLRGHNPPDIPALLANHERDRDYFAELETLLSSLTKFPHAFPAVSGATAVDLAVTLALMANPGRRKVVTFTGNFSGKTLFALNLSKHGPQLTESDSDAFRPYYADLVYVDPFAEDAEEKLEAILRAGDVGLVWFELIRGAMCEVLPEPILRLVEGLKEEGGYLIGVDEVLTGGWRTGPTYLAHQHVIRRSDVTSVGKTLGDMTVPMAAALVTDEVYQRVRRTHPERVKALHERYRYNLGAHIALNALTCARSSDHHAGLLDTQSEIEKGLRQIVASSKLFSGVAGRGALLLLVMNRRYFPFHHRSKLGNLLEMAMSHLIFIRCGVFVFLLRVLHRTATDRSDVRELISRLEEGLEGITPRMVYRHALSRILSGRFPRLARFVGVQANACTAMAGSPPSRSRPTPLVGIGQAKRSKIGG